MLKILLTGYTLKADSKKQNMLKQFGELDIRYEESNNKQSRNQIINFDSY